MIFIVLFTLPVAHTYRNHPNEYVYFNEFVGGLKNVYGDYETDYYFNSLKSFSFWTSKLSFNCLKSSLNTFNNEIERSYNSSLHL